MQVEAAGNDSAQAILTGAAAGTLQDVFFNENDVFQKLAQQGDLKDIAPVLKSLRFNLSDIVSIPSGTSYKGKQYGLPLQLTVQTMMINKTLFRENGVPLPDRTTTCPQWAEHAQADHQAGGKRLRLPGQQQLAQVAALRLGVRRRALDAGLEEEPARTSRRRSRACSSTWT